MFLLVFFVAVSDYSDLKNTKGFENYNLGTLTLFIEADFFGFKFTIPNLAVIVDFLLKLFALTAITTEFKLLSVVLIILSIGFILSLLEILEDILDAIGSLIP